MPDGIKFSELQSTLTLGNNDLAAVSHDNGDSTYTSVKVPMTQLGQKVVNDIDYTQALNTTSKKPIGAINELKNELMNIYPVLATSPAPIANFSTDLALPLKSLNVEIKPKQASGTPTPSNPLPISGTDTVIVTQTGMNLANIKPFANWIVKKSYLCNSADLPRKRTKLVFIDNDTSVSLSGINFGFFDTSWNGVSNISSSQYRWVINNGVIQSENRNIPLTNDTTIFLDGLFVFPNTEAAFNAVFARYKVMVIPENSTATTFEPYSATTKIVNLQSTVIGGEIDLIGGSGESNYTLANLSDLSWENSEQSGKTIFYAVIADKINNVNNIAYCEIFASATSSATSLANAASLLTSDFMICTSKNMTSPRIYIRADGYTVTQFANTISGYKVAYQVATPTPITIANPIDLTAKAGVNNVFGDTDGNTSVEFRESVQKYVDDNIAAVQALIL